MLGFLKIEGWVSKKIKCSGSWGFLRRTKAVVGMKNEGKMAMAG